MPGHDLLATAANPPTTRPRGRVFGDVAVHYLVATEVHYYKDVEGSEPDRMPDSEVTGPDDIGLVLEEGVPGLRGLTRSLDLDHVLADGGLRDRDAKLHLQL